MKGLWTVKSLTLAGASFVLTSLAILAGGHGGGEVRCWVAAAAAMAACGDYQPTVECYQTIPEWLTGMGLMRFESIRGEAS